MNRNVIAIDGPAASGKSSIARKLAERLGILYVNTGSLYRAVALKAIRSNIQTKDAAAVADMLKNTVLRYAETPEGSLDIELDGVFPGQELRAPEIAAGASDVAAIPAVREWTLGIQRKTAEHNRIVMEGRDIGTVVFPDAEYKFFLTATPEARAIRRLNQDGEAADGATVESVAAEIAARDKQDSMRAVAPLKQAEDALLVDNSGWSLEETLSFFLSRICRTASLSYRVPFADTDQMGVVYYANYLIYFEMCREELLRKIHFSYTDMEKAGYSMPVTEAVCKYKTPAHFEDILTIDATLVEAKGVRGKIACTVRRGNTVLAEGWTVHACLKDGKITRLPAEITNLMEFV